MLDTLEGVFNFVIALVSTVSTGLKEGASIVSSFFSSISAVSEFLPAIIITGFGCAVAFKVVMRVI